ncbi:MAG: peptidase [Curvibacter sp. RIFCSPHIGHO2_12_FULL_63_18]|uniref:peptidoglycan DD-metalloendopeptidase family protein n=1 Tax=Rhodoferax sp. TaxID=50421 RepID=UPI0008BBD079|nr:peptidoglycan DD-metalloendopeptidase family protein [Rhodoferax sp.]OGO99049.1 MAG: peptidase [Curvibacter sp. GWA2_63_95]OGP01311.1 MAG: peptidase [Curvibacter sp. RIFCSPHIGHO2_12_FULL_63_18]HCX82183.1 peptidase [Rhodoferax sp.]
MFGVRRLALAGACVAVVVLSGCGSTAVNRAPVEDRGSSAGKAGTVIDPRTQAVKQPPGFENAGKAGYYTVKPGDTLMRIGLETGQGHKDIARWNALDNPDKIEVGQVLRVVPPVADTVAVAKPVASSSATTTSLPAAGAASAPAKAASTPVAAASAPSTPAPAAAASGEDELAWIWPGNGPVVAGFDEAKNKGLDIGGNAGDPVLAAGEGKVVYAGAGLRGYGNLIILKHNNTYLTAYAHNQTLLVKEDQTVKKGQKIAEMGSSDADRVKLHFEVRRQGKPVDPARYLPAR